MEECKDLQDFGGLEFSKLWEYTIEELKEAESKTHNPAIIVHILKKENLTKENKDKCFELLKWTKKKETEKENLSQEDLFIVYYTFENNPYFNCENENCANYLKLKDLNNFDYLFYILNFFYSLKCNKHEEIYFSEENPYEDETLSLCYKITDKFINDKDKILKVVELIRCEMNSTAANILKKYLENNLDLDVIHFSLRDFDKSPNIRFYFQLVYDKYKETKDDKLKDELFNLYSTGSVFAPRDFKIIKEAIEEDNKLSNSKFGLAELFQDGFDNIYQTKSFISISKTSATYPSNLYMQYICGRFIFGNIGNYGYEDYSSDLFEKCINNDLELSDVYSWFYLTGDSSIEILNKALELDKSNYFALWLLSKCYLDGKDVDKDENKSKELFDQCNVEEFFG